MQWIALTLSLTGNILINYQKKQGFVIWTLANVIWIYLAFTRWDWAQVALFTVYTVLNIHGLYTWKNKKIIEGR